MTKFLKKLPRRAEGEETSRAYNAYIKQNMSFWFSDNLADWQSGYKVGRNRLNTQSKKVAS